MKNKTDNPKEVIRFRVFLSMKEKLLLWILRI